jgi:mycothiol synthase
VFALVQACDVALRGEADFPRAFVEDDWAKARVELERDSRIVLDPDGGIVGYMIGEAIDPSQQIEWFGMVHPDHTGRGIGSALNAWAEEASAARVRVGSSTSLKQSVDATNEPAKRLMQQRGFVYARTFWHMERELDDLVAPEPPAGIGIGVAPDGAKDPRVHATVNAAFEGHFGMLQVTYEDYMDDWVGSPLYDPELILIAQEGDQVVGAVTSVIVEPGKGWVAELAVWEPHRGRGIGKALLQSAFAALAAKGCSTARLNVDSSNPTGAPELYGKAGMHVHRAWSIFQKEVSGTAPV